MNSGMMTHGAKRGRRSAWTVGHVRVTPTSASPMWPPAACCAIAARPTPTPTSAIRSEAAFLRDAVVAGRACPLSSPREGRSAVPSLFDHVEGKLRLAGPRERGTSACAHPDCPAVVFRDSVSEASRPGHSCYSTRWIDEHPVLHYAPSSPHYVARTPPRTFAARGRMPPSLLGFRPSAELAGRIPLVRAKST